MPEVKHTPGPWRLGDFPTVVRSESIAVADCRGVGMTEDYAEAIANAPIAAAPDLLAACIAAKDGLQEGDPYGQFVMPIVGYIDAAIAKATGATNATA